MHVSRCSDLCLGHRTIILFVAKMNSLAVLFTPDLNFSITDPGSKAPDPGFGSARTDYVFSTPKNVAMLAEIWSRMFIPDPYFFPSRIPEPGVKSTGSWIPIRNLLSLKRCTNKKKDWRSRFIMSLWSLHSTAVEMLLVDCVLDPNATSSSVFRIRDMFVRNRILIRILGSIPSTNGSGSGSFSFRQWHSSCQQNKKVLKKLQNSRN